MRRRLGAVLLVALVVLAGCSSAPLGDSTTTTQEPSVTTTTDGTTEPWTTTTTEPPTTTSAMVEEIEDPPSDRLGWENGYWYNETLDVNRTGGLNQSELNAVVARGMARVEVIRELEFEEDVPVEIINRSEFRNRTADRQGNRTANQTLHQDVKLEAMFFVGEGNSATQTQQETTSASVLGYFSPENESIVIVSDNPDSPEMNEITLSQELFHAIQERTFNPSNFTQNTEERHNAKSGIIEGDGNYVDYLYEQRCDGGWNCLEPTASPGSGDGGGADPHVGLLALRLQPYSDGPPFVEDIYEAEGWEGVNEVYDQPPESTEQTIHPEKYLVDSPTNVTIEDRSGDEWYVPDQGEGHIDYAQFGEAGLFAMLWYPSHLESQAEGTPTDVIIPYREFFNGGPGELNRYNYDHPATAGWDGDKLLPYSSDESAETNETGYVWKTVWDSEEDAKEFAEAYESLLEYHDAESVPGQLGTYRIDDGEFADAFSVTRSGTNVTIVNAPSVDELSEIRDGP